MSAIWSFEANTYSFTSKLDIFPEEANKAQSQYLDYIPLAWTMCNNITDFALSTQGMWDMMVISVLNFQVGRFMEFVTGRLLNKEGFDTLRLCITQIFNSQCRPPEARPEKSRKVGNLHEDDETLGFGNHYEELQPDQS